MKIRKLLIGLSLAAFTLAVAQAPAPLKSFVEKLNAAEALEAQFSIRTLSGSASSYRINLAKPNKARIDTPERLIVADGETVTTLIKATKQFYKKDQNAKEFGKLFNNDELRAFGAFFNKAAFDKISSRQLAETRRKGEEMIPVELMLDASKSKTHTMYLAKKDGLLAQGIMEWKVRSGKETRIFDFEAFTLGKPRDVFSFKAPADSKEVTEADVLAVRWIENLDEAIAEAKASNRMIIVDFYATWCGPCHKMEAEVFPTERFRSLSSQFVFCRIDVDDQPSVAQQFKIEAMPTTAILDSEGNEKGRWVGYGDQAGYFAELGRVTGGSF